MKGLACMPPLSLTPDSRLQTPDFFGLRFKAEKLFADQDHVAGFQLELATDMLEFCDLRLFDRQRRFGEVRAGVLLILLVEPQLIEGIAEIVVMGNVASRSGRGVASPPRPESGDAALPCAETR